MSFKPEFITRHRDLISAEAMKKKIIIVGAGAIGGFVTLALAKMGYSNLHVIDFDTVEPENIGNQFFDIAAIGCKKTIALQAMVDSMTGITINIKDEMLTDKSARLSADIVISAVDSMAVRELIFELSDCYCLIDPRMGAEYATMNLVNAQDSKARKEYKASLFTDGEAVQERCTAKTTIYTVLLIAGQVVKAVKDYTTFNPDKPDEAADMITSLDWNIKKNAMLAFSDGRKL